MPEGIQDLEAAFAEAASESDSVQSDDVEATEPVAEADDSSIAEQAGDEAGDQPDVAETTDTDDDLVQQMLEGEPKGDEAAESAAVDFAAPLEVDLGDGPTTVTIQDLVEGNLRQRDYTQKTQELAAMRSDLTDAKKFYDTFMEDPVDFARALAVRAGVMDSDAPIRETDAVKVQSAEQFEAAVRTEVEARLANDPRMVQATQAAAVASVNAEFDRISAAHEMPIPAELRQSIVDEATRRGTADLELVFEARLARAKANSARAAEKTGAATKRPSASPAEGRPDEVEPAVATVEDAFEWAMAHSGA